MEGVEVLCPSCEKKLLLKLDPDVYCAAWCGTCGQEVPPETLLEGGVAKEVVDRIEPWGRKARELLEAGDDMAVGGERTDEEYIRDWKTLRDETVDLLRDLRAHVPAGTKVFGTPKPPEWSDSEILHWRRQREREGLLYSYGYQMGARWVEKEGGLPLEEADALPIDYPVACVTPSEKERYRQGFVLGSSMGNFDADLYAEITARLKTPPQRQTERRER